MRNGLSAGSGVSRSIATRAVGLSSATGLPLRQMMTVTWFSSTALMSSESRDFASCRFTEIMMPELPSEAVAATSTSVRAEAPSEDSPPAPTRFRGPSGAAPFGPIRPQDAHEPRDCWTGPQRRIALVCAFSVGQGGEHFCRGGRSSPVTLLGMTLLAMTRLAAKPVAPAVPAAAPCTGSRVSRRGDPC